MPELMIRSSSEARSNFSTVFDEAINGSVAVIERRHDHVVVASRDWFLRALVPSLPTIVAVAEDGGWSVMLPTTPVAGDGADLDAAVDEFLDALSEYADDWVDRLRFASNHAQNWPLVQFVRLSSPAALRDWVLAVPE